MTTTSAIYVQQTSEGGWRIADSRVSLDSVVHGFWEGKSPEAIADEFPTLSIEQIYGAIAHYLHHREELDGYLARQDADWGKFAIESNAKHGPLLERLRRSSNVDGRSDP